MSRNYFQAKNYLWERTHGMIACLDPSRYPSTEQFLFSIYDEGHDDNLINAYMKGYQDGQRDGAKTLANKIKGLLGL